MIGVARRRCMGGGGEEPLPTEYISDGLIFHLDGIDKGSNAGSWTDLVGGLVLAPVETSPTSIAKGWAFTGDGYFECSTLLPANADATLEICATCINMDSLMHSGTWGTNYLFFYPISSVLFFMQRNQSYVVGNAFQSGSAYYNKDITISVNNDRLMMSSSEITTRGSANFYSDPNVLQIGHYRSNYHTGNVYSIRVYNRRLTKEEQVHNMRVDKGRFNTQII